MNRKRPTRWLLLLPILPYLASLALPVDARGALPGYSLVVIGFMATFVGAPVVLIYWLPNPLLWLGIYLLDRRRIRSVLFVGTVAGLLAMLPIMKPDRILEEIIGSPANVAWLASVLLLVAAGYLALVFPRKPDSIQLLQVRESGSTEFKVSERAPRLHPVRPRQARRRGSVVPRDARFATTDGHRGRSPRGRGR
jgi:hypothetical protein